MQAASRARYMCLDQVSTQLALGSLLDFKLFVASILSLCGEREALCSSKKPKYHMQGREFLAEKSIPRYLGTYNLSINRCKRH